jgi:16S rRNA (cytosine967-C5)-methyltransferase
MSAAFKLTGFTFEHAVRALAGVLPAGVAADKGLSEYFRANPKLGSSDRNLIAETVYAVLRNRRSLAAGVGNEFPRDLALAALTRVRGMNLQQFSHVLRDGDAELIGRVKALAIDELPAAVRFDLPDWLWDRLVAERGIEPATALAKALKTPAPLTLRVNPVKSGRDEVIAALAASGFEATPTRHSRYGVVLAGKPALQRHPLFLCGAFEVQDEGSQLLAELVEPRRGEMVVDFCAGAGGKTLALGALMRSSGRLYAFDVSDSRLAKLKPRLARSGLSNVSPVRIDSENDVRVKRLAGKIDRVLVDAPCSGLGTLRRNPELKWRQTATDVAELAAKQAAILAGAARMVKPGGRLVYATCSLLREENAAVAEGFLAAHGEFAMLDAREILARREITLEAGNGPALELLPHLHGTDGFYAVALERRA